MAAICKINRTVYLPVRVPRRKTSNSNNRRHPDGFGAIILYLCEDTFHLSAFERYSTYAYRNIGFFETRTPQSASKWIIFYVSKAFRRRFTRLGGCYYYNYDRVVVANDRKIIRGGRLKQFFIRYSSCTHNSTYSLIVRARLVFIRKLRNEHESIDFEMIGWTNSV